MYSRVENPHGELTVREMFQRAGLLYEVEKQQLHYKDPDGYADLIRHLQGFDDPSVHPGQIRPARPPRLTKEEAEELVNAALVPSTVKRCHTLKVVGSPTEFDSVSDKWKIYQPTELVDWTEQMVDKFGLIPSAAGAFEGGKDAGKICWFQATLPGEHSLFKEADHYNPNFTVTNQQKYGTAWGGGFSATRIICKNSFHTAEASLQIKLDHRTVFDAEYVSVEIQKVAAQWIDYKEKMEFLGSRLTTGRAIVEYFQKIFPASDANQTSRAAELAVGAFTKQPGADIKRDSWYQAFNAVTYTTDHLLHHKNEQRRALSAQYGENARRKVEALKVALKMAEKSPALVD